MRKVTGYIILYDYSIESLNKEISEYVIEGWEPYEDLKITKYDYKPLFLQAMIKYS